MDLIKHPVDLHFALAFLLITWSSLLPSLDSFSTLVSKPQRCDHTFAWGTTAPHGLWNKVLALSASHDLFSVCLPSHFFCLVLSAEESTTLFWIFFMSCVFSLSMYFLKILLLPGMTWSFFFFFSFFFNQSHSNSSFNTQVRCYNLQGNFLWDRSSYAFTAKDGYVFHCTEMIYL